MLDDLEWYPAEEKEGCHSVMNCHHLCCAQLMNNAIRQRLLPLALVPLRLRKRSEFCFIHRCRSRLSTSDRFMFALVEACEPFLCLCARPRRAQSSLLLIVDVIVVEDLLE